MMVLILKLIIIIIIIIIIHKQFIMYSVNTNSILQMTLQELKSGILVYLPKLKRDNLKMPH